MVGTRAVRGLAVIAALTLTAGGGLIGGRSVAAPRGSGSRSVAAIARTPQDRERRAAAYAVRLTTDGPRMAGETRLTKVPAKLEQPDQTIGVNNLVVRKRYWSVAGSPLHVYRTLKKAPVKHLRLSGYGPPGAGGSASNYADVFYTRAHLPSYLDEADLYVEILGRSDGTTDIAAFAEVVPYPKRQATEVVPTDNVDVTVSRTNLYDRGSAPLRRATLTVAKAHRLVAAFDAAKVNPPGVCIGGPPPPFGYAAKMTTKKHTWRIDWSGLDNCDALAVTRDGKFLPNIQTTPKLFHLLKVDVAGPDGYIDGGFYKVKDDSLLPLEGTVTLTQSGQVVATYSVDEQGSYEFIVPPGTYKLTGTSPDFHHGTVTCSGQHRAHVHKGRTSNDEVRCTS
jgi:hypothetical protein